MKKLLTVLLMGLLLLGAAACTKKEEDISGYYALTEISKDGEVIFDEELIKEYLYPSFGYSYLDVADDGTAILNYAGYDEAAVYDRKEKTFMVTDQEVEEVYSFVHKNDQLILTEQADDAYAFTFTKAERPADDDVLVVDDGSDFMYNVDINTDPSVPGYFVYETDTLKAYVPDDLNTYPSKDEDYELIVDGEKVVMFVQSIPISELTDEDITMEDIREAIYEGNDIVDGDLRYMTYTSEAEGTDYFFIYSLMNDKVNFYDVTLICYEEEKDLYKDVMLDILSRLQLKNK